MKEMLTVLTSKLRVIISQNQDFTQKNDLNSYRGLDKAKNDDATIKDIDQNIGQKKSRNSI